MAPPNVSFGTQARAEGSEGHGHVDDLEDRELQPFKPQSRLADSAVPLVSLPFGVGALLAQA